MTQRLTHNHWLDIGLEALTLGGQDALGLETLCAKAGKTKGSFYHHFESTEDFMEKVLKRWERQSTTRIIETTRNTKGVKNKLAHLNKLASTLNHRTEVAVRRLAAHNSVAQKSCARVDDIRIGYLAEIYASSSRYSPREAGVLARVEYATWVGLQLMNPDIAPKEIINLYQDFLALSKRNDH